MFETAFFRHNTKKTKAASCRRTPKCHPFSGPKLLDVPLATKLQVKVVYGPRINDIKDVSGSKAQLPGFAQRFHRCRALVFHMLGLSQVKIAQRRRVLHQSASRRSRCTEKKSRP
jgi:hypothetical protein